MDGRMDAQQKKVHGGRRNGSGPGLFQRRLLPILAQIAGQRLEDPAGQCFTSRGRIRLFVIGKKKDF
jgi:hypothetical protein